MTKRKKELFELLSRERPAAPASSAPSRSVKPDEPQSETAPERSRPQPVETPEPTAAPRRPGFGGRKIPVSLNVLLLFIGAFVVSNVCSYIVGKGMSGQNEVPLTTEMRLFFAVKVTPPVEARHSFAVWELRDRLHDAGFERTEVLGLDNGKYLQIVAGRFDRDRRDDCNRLVRRVKSHFARNVPSKKKQNDEFVIPIDVRAITISYTPYTQREPDRAP